MDGETVATGSTAAVERAIRSMRQNLEGPLTIDDLARSAMLSRFHFSRVFGRATGVSPGRFLSALRLDEAKRLLLTTSSTVTEIGHRVGYTSTGTFSTRFSRSVGMPPIVFRRVGGRMELAPIGPSPGPDDRSAVRGTVGADEGVADFLVFIGVFAGAVPEGAPVAVTVVRGPGRYALPPVPPGHWHLAAESLLPVTLGGTWRRVAWRGRVVAPGGGRDTVADIVLGPPCPTHPPLLSALPDLRLGQAATAAA